MNLAGPGVFNLVDCSLNASTQCVMSATATRAAFTGCTFSPSQKIVNSGNASNLLVDARQSISNAMPIVNWTDIMNSFNSYQPIKTNLFVATSYGVTGNGSNDDTVAIQSALNAAGTNGGGIVYLPPGMYHLTNTLDVPDGVELLGSYEARHNSSAAADGIVKGAILQPYGGQGTTNGPPAIALEANAGLVGMTINYVSQNSNCIPYPPTIQGRGPNVYVIGVVCPDSYYYVDLDTYTCTNHLIDMVDCGGLKVGVHAGNGSSGSIVDCVFGPYANGFSFGISNLEAYVFGDCTELLVKDFAINEYTFMHFSSENGRGPSVTAISAMCDVAYQGFVFDSSAPCTFTDVNPEWLVVLGHGYPGLTNALELITTTNFQGTVRIFNSPLWGNPQVNCVVNGGDIGFELVHLWQTAWAGSQVNGGVFHLVNAGAYADPYPFPVTFGANAGIAGKTNEFIGCYAYYGCAYTNLNSSNPANVWMDYALSSYSVLGGPPNLALNRPVSVSSVADSTQAANAVDGNLNTRWGSAYSDPQWIYVDLGTNYNITSVGLVWESAYGKAYQIQVSTNATAWTTIYSTTNGAGGTEYLTGLSGVGRYVRMYGTQRGTIYGYSLWEFQVFGTLAVPPAAPTTLIASLISGGQIMLSWTTNGAAVTPYYTSNLTPPITWIPVTNTPVLSGNQWTVTLPVNPASNCIFYRLQQ